MSEIRNLQPAAIWHNFDDLTQIPRPSGHVEKVQQFLLDFAKRNWMTYIPAAASLGVTIFAIVSSGFPSRSAR